MSRSRQNWSDACEGAINRQINLEFKASFYYLNLYMFFQSDSVNMPKIAEYFKKQSDEEKEHAEKFINYQILRGGTPKIGVITETNLGLLSNCKAKSYLKIAFLNVLTLEKEVNNSLLEIHALGDANLCDFIESEFLREQLEANDELSRIINDLEFIGDNKFDLLNYIRNFSIE